MRRLSPGEAVCPPTCPSWKGSVSLPRPLCPPQPHPLAAITASGLHGRPPPAHSAWHEAGTLEPFTERTNGRGTPARLADMTAPAPASGPVSCQVQKYGPRLEGPCQRSPCATLVCSLPPGPKHRSLWAVLPGAITHPSFQDGMLPQSTSGGRKEGKKEGLGGGSQIYGKVQPRKLWSSSKIKARALSPSSRTLVKTLASAC